MGSDVSLPVATITDTPTSWPSPTSTVAEILEPDAPSVGPNRRVSQADQQHQIANSDDSTTIADTGSSIRTGRTASPYSKELILA